MKVNQRRKERRQNEKREVEKRGEEKMRLGMTRKGRQSECMRGGREENKKRKSKDWRIE